MAHRAPPANVLSSRRRPCSRRWRPLSSRSGDRTQVLQDRVVGTFDSACRSSTSRPHRVVDTGEELLHLDRVRLVSPRDVPVDVVVGPLISPARSSSTASPPARTAHLRTAPGPRRRNGRSSVRTRVGSSQPTTMSGRRSDGSAGASQPGDAQRWTRRCRGEWGDVQIGRCRRQSERGARGCDVPASGHRRSGGRETSEHRSVDNGIACGRPFAAPRRAAVRLLHVTRAPSAASPRPVARPLPGRCRASAGGASAGRSWTAGSGAFTSRRRNNGRSPPPAGTGRLSGRRRVG